MAHWKLQSVQAAWFVNGKPVAHSRDIYAGLLKQQPQSSQANQIPNMPGQMMDMAAGQVGDRACQVQIQPGRVDFNLAPATPPGSAPPTEPPFFANHDAVIDDVSAMLGGVTMDGAVVTRIALIAVFAEPAKSLVDANQVALQRIGLQDKFPEPSDFTFQLNAVRPSKVDESINLNRIMNWNTATYQFLQFPVAPTGGAGSLVGFGGSFGMAVPQSRQTYAAIVTIDVNTQFRPDLTFSSDQQRAIFEECAAEAKRLAAANSPQALL